MFTCHMYLQPLVLGVRLIHMWAVPTATTSQCVFNEPPSLPEPEIQTGAHTRISITFYPPTSTFFPPSDTAAPSLWFFAGVNSPPAAITPEMFSWIFIKAKASAQRGESLCGQRELATSSSGTTLVYLGLAVVVYFCFYPVSARLWPWTYTTRKVSCFVYVGVNVYCQLWCVCLYHYNVCIVIQQ